MMRFLGNNSRRGASRHNVSAAPLGRGNQRSSATMQTRRGMSLIQMLVSILLVGVISTAAITMIIRMMMLEGRSTHVWVEQHNLLRLSNDFRRDVHSAQSAEIVKQNDRLTLILRLDETGTKFVRFAARPDGAMRQTVQDEKVVASESYELMNSQLRFEVLDDKSVRLTCDLPTSQPLHTKMSVPRREEQILAVLSRNQRYEKRSEAKSK